MATKQENVENVKSCWSRAEDDEPVFVLKATDASAPDLVRRWAVDYKKLKVRLGCFGSREAEKYNDALSTADAMVEWRNTQQDGKYCREG